MEFSFSGLKTAVRYQIAGPGVKDLGAVRLEPQEVADVAASFQEAVVDVLAGKTRQALKQTGLQTLCVGGGVAANARLRQRLESETQSLGVALHIPPLRLCTDNAVMGAIAVERIQAGLYDELDTDIKPGLVRG